MQNDIAPKSSLMLGDFASGVCFSNKVCRSDLRQFWFLVVRTIQPAFFPGLQGWMFGPLGWSSGPAKLIVWPLQLKPGTAADFNCKLFLKNKTQRQSHLTLGYFLVQYHFALHPPFKIEKLNMLRIAWNELISQIFHSFGPDEYHNEFGRKFLFYIYVKGRV